MRVLVIKTSSMGDVIHTYPALTDAKKAIPEITFDWLVEEAFVDLAALHPAVDCVIPFALRRWKKSLRSALVSGEIRQWIKQFRQQDYDVVIDAQGLIKSAIPTLLAKANSGRKIGLDRQSIREPLAAFAYREKYAIGRQQHAILRVRKLFAQALQYRFVDEQLDYGINNENNEHHQRVKAMPEAWFIHSTSWNSKLWPESYWVKAIQLAQQDGYAVKLPWGSEVEKQRAERLTQAAGYGNVLPQLSLAELADQLRQADIMLGLDTGLSHLAAAMDVPSVVVYGSTASHLTGVLGNRQRSLQMDYACVPCLKRECHQAYELDQRPCYMTVKPKTIWQAAKALI